MEISAIDYSVGERVLVKWGVRIPLRDGIRLNATVYLPKGQRAAAPVIITLTPYIAQTYHDIALYFASQGYPFLAIDVRGRGNSDGHFRALIQEAYDGFDVVEWVARQDFCNGRVAMWGGSYAGYDQWATAKEQPTHLTTIVPCAAAYASVNFPIRCNMAAPYWMQWLMFVWGRTSQEKLFWNNKRYWGERFREWLQSGTPFKDLDSRLGCPSEIFQDWASHPHQSAYWDAYNPTLEQYAHISIPVLSITGIYDVAQIGAITHFRKHLQQRRDAEHYLIIGPWDHAGTRSPALEFAGIKVGPASLLDLPKLHLQWYAWTMQEGPKPPFLRERIAYYVIGADTWRYAPTLEAITDRSEPLYLQSNGVADDVLKSGSLSRQLAPEGPPDRYVYDPRDTSLAAIESAGDPDSRVDQRMLFASIGRLLVYHTDPFGRDMEISGFFRLTLWLAIDTPDTDFRVSVWEVALDGSATQLSYDALRARYRENCREPRLVDTTDALPYQFENFPFTARRVKRGHRLRLIVGPINSIYGEKNYNAGGLVAEESMQDARTVTVRLFHDSAHPSVLYIPHGRGDSEHV